MNSIFIKIASTEQELLSAYQLRYEVFYQEEGDSRYADHDLKIWKDIDDIPASTIFIAQTPEKETVGSVRLTKLIDP